MRPVRRRGGDHVSSPRRLDVRCDPDRARLVGARSRHAEVGDGVHDAALHLIAERQGRGSSVRSAPLGSIPATTSSITCGPRRSAVEDGGRLEGRQQAFTGCSSKTSTVLRGPRGPGSARARRQIAGRSVRELVARSPRQVGRTAGTRRAVRSSATAGTAAVDVEELQIARPESALSAGHHSVEGVGHPRRTETSEVLVRERGRPITHLTASSSSFGTLRNSASDTSTPTPRQPESPSHRAVTHA